MQEVLIAGAGRMGGLIATLLASTPDYHVHVADQNIDLNNSSNLNISQCHLDMTDSKALVKYIKQHALQAVISCLPYHLNISLANIAKKNALHYFDLTEDVMVQNHIAQLARGENKCFAPQCGLAPGFISIVTQDLMSQFEEPQSVLMRVGALPQFPHNALKYLLTWSTEGLINEYSNTCYALEEKVKISLQPLEGLESIELDGALYEAFNTSGGLGTLVQTYSGKVKTMNYKTLRYPGHCEKMVFLMKDLKLNEDRETLKKILETALPRTLQDVVIVYVSVSGKQNGKTVEKNYLKKIYPQPIMDQERSAITIATATSACAVVDLVLQNQAKYQGLILQESFPLKDFLNNRFGKYYA